MKSVQRYQTPDGKIPFQEWFDDLTEKVKGRILAYVGRVARGGSRSNLRSVGEGVHEIKIDTGPGYRVYFGNDGESIILLLLGGSKRTQDRDIKRAQEYWRNYHAQN